MMTNKQAEGEVRRIAKSAGLTFKRKPNHSYLYIFTVRGSNEVVAQYTLTGAYEDCCSGYIASWDGHSFAGI